MFKRDRVRGRSRALLVMGGVFALGAFMQIVATAGVPAPTAHIQDATSVGYINASEVSTQLTVTGTYTAPASDDIIVFIVSGSSCSLGSPNVAGPKHATLNANGTWSASPFDVSSFPDGVTLCARARASDDGKVVGDPSKSYTDLATSDNTPIKDTVVLTGTAALIDPNNDGYLNKAEATALTVRANWTGAGDSSAAKTWFLDNTSGELVGCDSAPIAIADYTEALSGTKPVPAACVAALPQNQPFTFNAKWRDAAENTSAVAGSNSLIKDTVAPAAPTVAITTTPLNAANIHAVTVEGTAEPLATVIITVKDGVNVVSGSTTAGAGSPSGAYSKTFDLAALNDCPTTACIVAEARAVDLAGNAGPSGSAAALKKDTVAPDAPVVNINPKPIDYIHQTFVEMTVSGETDSVATLKVTDDALVPESLADIVFTLTSSRTVYVNVSSLHDGLITATATLTDAFGNVSLPGVDTARKSTTGPAITLTSPAANSLNPGVVKVAGAAIKDASITLKDETGKKINASSIIAGTNGNWAGQVTYSKSGTHTLTAHTNTCGAPPPCAAAVTTSVTFDVDAGRPIATITTAEPVVKQAGESLKLEGTARDDFSGVFGIQVVVFDSRNNEVSPGPLGSPPIIRLGKAVFDGNALCPLCPSGLNVGWSIDLSFLQAGTYTVKVTAVDNIANRATAPAEARIIKLG